MNDCRIWQLAHLIVHGGTCKPKIDLHYAVYLFTLAIFFASDTPVFGVTLLVIVLNNTPV